MRKFLFFLLTILTVVYAETFEEYKKTLGKNAQWYVECGNKIMFMGNFKNGADLYFDKQYFFSQNTYSEKNWEVFQWVRITNNGNVLTLKKKVRKHENWFETKVILVDTKNRNTTLFVCTEFNVDGSRSKPIDWDNIDL